MANITTRAELIQYCLRRLGAPVLEINVDEDQLYDRVDEAIKFFQTYNYEAVEKTFYTHLVTNTDKTNKYIDMPENIVGAVKVYPTGIYAGANNMFNIRYQIALNDMYTLTSQSLLPWYMTMQHLQFMEQILVGEAPIRYTKSKNRLYIDMDWSKINTGNYLLIEAYSVIDPDDYNRLFNDIIFQRYTTALIKRQWGLHLTKFIGMTLPGGVQFNGEKILQDAEDEIAKLEEKIFGDYNVSDALYMG